MQGRHYPLIFLPLLAYLLLSIQKGLSEHLDLLDHRLLLQTLLLWCVCQLTVLVLGHYLMDQFLNQVLLLLLLFLCLHVGDRA